MPLYRHAFISWCLFTPAVVGGHLLLTAAALSGTATLRYGNNLCGRCWAGSRVRSFLRHPPLPAPLVVCCIPFPITSHRRLRWYRCVQSCRERTDNALRAGLTVQDVVNDGRKRYFYQLFSPRGLVRFDTVSSRLPAAGAAYTRQRILVFSLDGCWLKLSRGDNMRAYVHLDSSYLCHRRRLLMPRTRRCLCRGNGTHTRAQTRTQTTPRPFLRQARPHYPFKWDCCMGQGQHLLCLGHSVRHSLHLRLLLVV